MCSSLIAKRSSAGTPSAGRAPPLLRITAPAAYDGDELAAIHVNPDRCATLARILRRDHQGLGHGVVVGPLRSRIGDLGASGRRDL